MTEDEIQLIYSFKAKAAKCIEDNNIDLFNKTIGAEEYSALKIKDKQWYVLKTALLLSNRYVKATDFLKYLIFDYKISEDIFREILKTGKEEQGQQMFSARKLAEELYSQLKFTDNDTDKKPKV